MSTFSGIGTAASALAAARRGMDVVGQNIANQNTEGYTRQRVTAHAVDPVVQLGRFSTAVGPGHGVAVTGIARLGDSILDSRHPLLSRPGRRQRVRGGVHPSRGSLRRRPPLRAPSA